VTAKKNLVRVTIMNEEYSIRSDVSPERTREVAAYLDQAIRRVLDSGTVVEANRAAILAALHVTGELFEARQGADPVMAQRIKTLSAEVRRMLPPAKRGEAAG
jgi:cell division protein ZapA (FtsZ GTPase activity inhibitor)